MTAKPPWRVDSATMICPVCDRGFAPAGRRRYCSDPDIAARSVDGCPSAASAPVVAAMIAQTPTPSRTTSPTPSKLS